MGKTLIIAEKPSVMTDLSKALTKALGKFEKVGAGRDIHYENDTAIITSAVGHLVELRMPMGPNGKKLPWKFDVLPAIPETFTLDPIEQSEAKLKKVLKFAKRKDVDLIINACDAGREGELIFRYIMEIGKIDKPSKRMWMQSMTTGAIVEAWENLRTDEQMKPLADAAKCRSESDWLVGLNATRALTCFNSRHGGFNITAAGRVQTPTLAILAAREEEIQAFEPEPYFEVHGTMNVATGEYLGKWIDTAFKKSSDKPHGRAERIWDQEKAKAIVERCAGKTATISDEKKSSKQIPPQLYDLTTLQREAPFSAKGTLQIAQALYEKHKVLTYPRTDSRYLPEDYVQNVRETMQQIGNSDMLEAKYAKAVLAGKNKDGPHLHESKRIFNTAKVSDHFAIIPTGNTAKLSDTEQKVYDMVVKRFIAVFYPHAEFEQTTRLSTITEGGNEDVFKTEGRVLVVPGWLEVYGRKPGVAAGKDDLVGIKAGETAKADPIELIHEQTRPPARFTESTLLSAMEGAGKLLVNDEELREAMSERGLGTPATRAATIEGLISQKYLIRDGRDLHVTPSGLRLIRLVKQMDIEGLYSPKLTGDWEYKLRQMEQGGLKRPEFMKEIIDYTNEIVAKAHGLAEEAKSRKFPDVEVEHPIHGTLVLRQTDATYESRDPELPIKIKKYIAGRELTETEVKTLLNKGIVGPLQGFKSRFNKPFDASIQMDEKFKTTFLFEGDDNTAPELNEDMVIGTAKTAEGKEHKVYGTDKAYYVPDIVTKKDPHGVRIGKVILQREIPDDQALKLISEGKTDLLRGFISNRTKRKFDAHLTFDLESAKIGFDFPPRPAKKAAKKAAKKTEE
ncbi:MAG: DNA topoisomerase [Akkermansiaceae bacterium]|jgi:DNA topoisomerase III|nr:DNA topoisomerase [Akkermansiaceae bacterium]MDP4647878.1 DNA topoisomerase [Akkermansiaceae bacterium]MDP4722016.1 DNA topoisomerase [Akkermansiaceae bacterium]MDP4780676.1 DNA topoisomerase [Akkermansiaceae bacterium]MDP4846105.1 DNA topoisomerase [Akkermansiaceae bacterium]